MMRLGIAFASLLTVVACQQHEILVPRPPSLQRTWVAIEPIQCLGNPWERDWLESHGGDYASYPKDPTTPGLEPKEVEIIKDFYRRRGVVVFRAETRPKYEVVCAACSCPEGHTLYLQVRLEDLETMLSYGYREESPT